MKFDYTPVFDPQNPTSKAIRKSVVDIELFGPEKQVEIAFAIVDSGADLIVLNSEYANRVGVDLNNATKGSLVGISPGRIEVLFADVEIRIKGTADKIPVRVAFIDSPNVNALLGQSGFFDAYKIKFEKKKNRFEIDPA